MFGLGKKHHGYIRALAISPDGTRCVTGAIALNSPDKDARVWALPSLKPVGKLKGHQDGIGSAAWSPCGRLIVTAGHSRIEHRRTADTALKLLVEPRRIDDNAMRLWDANTGDQIGQFGADLHPVNELAYSRDGQRILTASRSGWRGPGPEGDQSLLRLWDLKTHTELSRFGSHRTNINSVAFSPEERLIACGGSTPLGKRVSAGMTFYSPDLAARVPTLRLFETASRREVRVFEYFQTINSIKFSPDGIYLLTVGEECILWDVASGRQVLQFRPEGFRSANSVDISTDGKYVAIGCGQQDEVGCHVDCCVWLWRLAAAKEIITFRQRRAALRVAFIPAQKTIVAAGDSGEIHLWQAPN